MKNKDSFMIDPNNKSDRILMFLPGFITWTVLLVPIWLGFFAPKLAAFILTFLTIYWIYMAITHGYGLIKGYRLYRKEVSIDWYKKCKELDFTKLPNKKTLPESLEQTKHFILIPTVTEDFSILKSTIESIINSNYPIKNIILVIATEEIGEKIAKKTIKQAKRVFGKKLPRIMHFIHPKGMPREIVGVASPNRAWAARHAVKQFKKEGANIKNYIFTTYDSDWNIHKEFIPRLTYEYITDPKRHNRFYETVVHLFTNNLWDVPLIPRIEANNVMLGMLSHWTSSPLFKESFSCYSCALDTLIASDYWDTTMIDDTVFYWRAFNARKGDFSAKHFYIPIYGDATGGTNYLKAHTNLYKQLVRWGWGSITTVLAIKALFSSNAKKTSLENKIIWLYAKAERHIIMRSIVFLNTLGFTVVSFMNEHFKTSAVIYGLPKIISVTLTSALIMFIPVTYIRIKLYGDKIPKNFNVWRKFLMYLEGPLVIINLLTYSFIPFIYAETMMMFGKLPKTTFYTPKLRK